MPKRAVNADLQEVTGCEVVALDAFEVSPGDSFTLTVESFDDKRRHGIWIGTEGGVSFDGDEPTRWGVLWVSRPGEQHTVTVGDTDGLLRTYNVWQSPHNQSHRSLADSSGMLVALDGNARRYRCEDFSWEPTFTSIVFTLRRA